MKKIIPFMKIPANRIILLLLLDVMSIVMVSFGALFLRFEFDFDAITPVFLENYVDILPFTTLSTIAFFVLFKLYKSVWRYASATEMVNIGYATTCAAIVQTVFCYVTGNRMPRSYYVLYWFFLFVAACMIRFSYRAMRIVVSRRRDAARGVKKNNVMVIGAGAAGNVILKEIESSLFINLKVKCIIDDHTGCHGKILRGVPIVGGRERIIEACEKYEIDEIILAIPSAGAKERKDILAICKETGCKLRTLPGMYQLINGDVAISKLKDVDIEDLLGREPVQTNIDEVVGYVSNKVVMVTGGGGSIGSELCRQIAMHQPKQLIIVDIYENNAYEIQQELLRKYPNLNLVVLIASVRNTNRINRIFKTYCPNIVYHAAAHKHVPLMETSPNEAIKNNVMGTYKTAQAADKYGVEKFVLISTDKAVNPTNIMGASKRICEMVVQMMNQKSKTNYVAVRFGNVLGSNGSVIPLFKKQIAEGGPVTVTHPDIIRYFMTIPEAVALVLQAGAYAQGGEIFVLDMGEPVRIADLAKNLIKLSGYRVGEDIEIKYTGLRPGEKMYEELLMSEEGLRKTENKMIFIGRPIDFDVVLFEQQLQRLGEEAKSEDADIRRLVKEIVPTYQYSGKNK